MDVNELKKTLSIFKTDNGLHEVRVINMERGSENYSAIFDNDEDLIREVSKYDIAPYNVYFIFNELKLATKDKLQHNKFLKNVETIKDSDVNYLRWMMIDLDPIREGGVKNVSASNEEFENAHSKALEVYKFIKNIGFPEPVVCKSGNGYHLQVRLNNIANNEENTGYIRDFFNYMSMLFTDEKVDFDTKNFNAARLTKLYSTTARKGFNGVDRPHRMSCIVKYPQEIIPCDFEIIKTYANKYRQIKYEDSQNNTYGIKPYNNNESKFDIDEFLRKYNIEVYKETRQGTSRKIVLKECPFHPEHGKDSAIFVSNNGAIAFTCFHNGCSNNTWRDLRLKFEPNAYSKEKTYNQYENNVPRQYNNKNYKPKYEIKEETQELGKKWLQLSDIQKMDLSEIETIKTGLDELDKTIGGFAMGELSILSGSNACVDCDTEFFNGKEWKKISDYQEEDMVLQYNYDGSANLVKPLRYIKEPCQQLYLIKTKMGVNQCASEDHNIVYCTSKGHLQKKQVKDLVEMHNNSKYGFNGKFYTTFKYNGCGIDLTDAQIRVMCAVICDGSFKISYRDKSIVRINLKKKKKKDRLEHLLKEANIEYLKKQYNPKDAEYNSYIFKSPRIEKEFSEYWYNCTSSQLKVITEEILFWDGSVKNQTFSQNSKKTIDFIQFAFASTGKRSSIFCDNRTGQRHSKSNYVYKHTNYILNICSNNMVSIKSNKNKTPILKYKTKDGYKYCFTVPSGMLVLRRGGNINITSNCGKTSWINQLIINVIQQNYKVALWSGELQPRMLKIWISLCCAGQNYIAKSKFDERYYVPNDVNTAIDQWMNGKFYLYNNDYSNKWEQIFNDFQEMVEKGVKLFILDNLFSLDIDIFEGDKNNKQKELIMQLCDFVKKKNVHILLVAHPRKSLGFLRKNDISGTSDIMNAASNIFILHRVNIDFMRLGKEFFGASKIDEYSGFGNVLEVCKNRLYGIDGLLCGMYYNVPSRRFLNSPEEIKHYGWEDNYKPNRTNYAQNHIEIPQKAEVPTYKTNDEPFIFSDNIQYPF